jgi:hypothetical protein
LVCLIAGLSASSALAQQTSLRKTKATKSKPVAVENAEVKKTEPAPDPAEEAIKALRTLATVAEIGTTYSDYTTRLVDVKIKVDELLAKIPAGDEKDPRNPKPYIQMALKDYVSAARYWNILIKGRYSNESSETLLSAAWNSAKADLDLATMVLNKNKKK